MYQLSLLSVSRLVSALCLSSFHANVSMLERIQRVVFAHADVKPGVPPVPVLLCDDPSRPNLLPVTHLHAEVLRL